MIEFIFLNCSIGKVYFWNEYRSTLARIASIEQAAMIIAIREAFA
jgi:hypothetical protein